MKEWTDIDWNALHEGLRDAALLKAGRYEPPPTTGERTKKEDTDA